MAAGERDTERREETKKLRSRTVVKVGLFLTTSMVMLVIVVFFYILHLGSFSGQTIGEVEEGGVAVAEAADDECSSGGRKRVM